jgi:hypothetical protein
LNPRPPLGLRPPRRSPELPACWGGPTVAMAPTDVNVVDRLDWPCVSRSRMSAWRLRGHSPLLSCEESILHTSQQACCARQPHAGFIHVQAHSRPPRHSSRSVRGRTHIEATHLFSAPASSSQLLILPKSIPDINAVVQFKIQRPHKISILSPLPITDSPQPCRTEDPAAPPVSPLCACRLI